MTIDPIPVIAGTIWLASNIYLGIHHAAKPEDYSSIMYSETFDEGSILKKVVMSVFIPGETIVHLARKYHRR
jgi:hypothetical protein